MSRMCEGEARSKYVRVAVSVSFTAWMAMHCIENSERRENQFVTTAVAFFCCGYIELL